MRHLAALFLLLLLREPLGAADWLVETVTLPAAPERVVLTDGHGGLDAVRVRTRTGDWFRLDSCTDGVCAKPVESGPSRPAPPHGALPDAVVATGMRNIRQAWLASPTKRYRHGVLGDAVEAGALVAVDANKRTHRLGLGAESVFEDLSPRLSDLDGDGADEIVIVRSYAVAGAALAVAELGPAGLAIAAESPPIGRPFRWLNPAGIADFDGDGRLEVAVVVTPHIGGTLEFWEYGGGRLRREARLHGFSNHVIGSRVLEMSALADFDGDGVADLALPSADRRAIRIVSLAGGTAVARARVALRGAAVTEIVAILVPGAARPAILVGLDSGKLAILR